MVGGRERRRIGRETENRRGRVEGREVGRERGREQEWWRISSNLLQKPN